MKILGASLDVVIIVFIWSIFMGITAVSIGFGSIFPALVGIAGPVVCPHGQMALESRSYQVSPGEGGYTLTWYCIDKASGAKTELDFFPKHLVAGSFYGLLIFAAIAILWVRAQNRSTSPDAYAAGAGKSRTVLGFIVAALIFVFAVVPFFVLNIYGGPVGLGVNLITQAPPTAVVTPTPQGLLFSIDGSGTGAGHFSDVRSLSVDPANGTLFAGEYSIGRVLAFDASGRYLTSWSEPGGVRGLAADGHGNLFVVNHSNVLRYDATGKLGATLVAPDDVLPDDVAVAPDGSLVIAGEIFSNGGVKSAITRMSADGQALGATILAPFIAHGGQSEQDFETPLAVDRAGNIYELGPASGGLFEFSAQGTFIHRLALPDKLSFAEAFAMDGRGRLYLADVGTIKVLDGDAGVLASLPVGGSEIRGMAIGYDRLYVALNDDQIVVLNLPNP